MFAASKSGSPAEATDAQFNYVTMLLHGDGTNGAQNNTFLDSSTNNFTITRNGNTTQGTFTPYGSNWSNFFDGSGDYLTIADNAALELSTSSFTMEWWSYPTTFASNQFQLSKCATSTSTEGFLTYINTSGVLKFNANSSSGWDIANDQGTVALNLNAWNHCAISRSGSSWRIWVNGVSSVTITSSLGVQNTTTAYSIGGAANGSAPFLGYMSNTRIVIGSYVYDPASSTLTIPTSPLTAITNTQLLTCQSNRFLDTSSNAFTITKNGDTSVQRFSPFSPTSAYSTSVIGGSGYFDGSGDYLSLPNATAFDQNAAFTFEFFDYLTSNGTTQGCFYTLTSGYLTILRTSTGAYSLNKSFVGDLHITSAFAFNAWHHVAVSYDGTNTRFYVDGVLQYTASGGGVACGASPQIGAAAGGDVAKGFISNFRFVKSALYTGSTLTIPTAPLTAVSNTSFLLSATNAGILDNAMMNDLETVGNAQISTSVKKYGTGSLAFDGSGDWLQAVSTPQADFGSGNFTLECWAYLNNFSTDYRLMAKVVNISSYGSWQVIVDTSGYPRFYASSAASSWDVANGTGGGIAISTSTWAHIAVTRSGSTITMWVNGVSAGTSTSSASLYYSASVPVTIGGMPDGTRSLNGNLDDVRITKGLARYTSTFTPSTTAFADKG